MSRRVSLLLIAAAATAAASFACLSFTAHPRASAVAGAPCGEELFGYVRSLVPSGAGYQLRFDPALFTSGETANDAAAEDGVVSKGEPVPNDNYVVDESRRTYLYRVAATARLTVLTDAEGAGPLYATPVTLAELAELVHGGEPVKLFEPLATGFHARVHVDTVCALDQQYLP